MRVSVIDLRRPYQNGGRIFSKSAQNTIEVPTDVFVKIDTARHFPGAHREKHFGGMNALLLQARLEPRDVVRGSKKQTWAAQPISVEQPGLLQECVEGERAPK